MELDESKQEGKSEILNKAKKSACGSPKLAAFALGLVVIIILAAGALAVFGWQSAKKLSQDGLTMRVADIFNFAAAKVNGEAVLYADYIRDVNVLNKFYTNPPAGYTKPTTEQISDQVITRLVANKIVQATAKEFGVSVTDEDMETAKTDLLANFESEEDAARELADRYGWDMPTYMEKVVRPLLLEQNLQKAFETLTSDKLKDFQVEEVRASHILFMVDDSTSDETARESAQKVLDRIKAGEDFATLAKEFGSDGTKEEGGDLGWFGMGAMVPEFEKAVFALELGQLKEELVKTQFGYHIVKLTDRREKNDFAGYMENQLKTANIKLLSAIHNPFEELLSGGTETDDTAPEAVEESGS